MGSRPEGSGDVEYAQHLVANCRLGLGIAKHAPLDKHRIVSHLITCTKLNAGGKTNLCSRPYLSVDCLCGTRMGGMSARKSSSNSSAAKNWKRSGILCAVGNEGRSRWGSEG